MKKLILFSFVLLLGFVFAAAAGDLGEAAKKEKARREELAKSGKKVTTFTNADVENLKATATYEFSSESPESGETAGEGGTADQGGAKETAAEAPAAETPATSDIDRQIEDLKNQREQAEQEEKAARETVGQGGLFHSHNAGNQYQTAREAEKKAEDADQKTSEAEAEKARQEQEQEPQ